MTTSFKKDDNPAGRVYLVLRDAPSPTLSKLLIRDAWARLLNIESSSNTVEIYRQLGLLTSELDRAERLLRETPHFDEAYIEDFPALRKGLAPQNLGVTWDHVQTSLHPGTLKGLKLAALQLSHTYSQGRIKDDEYEEIKKAVDEAFNYVVASEIDYELRVVLLDLLETIRRALADYRIRGTAGLREATSKAVGEIILGWQQTEGTEDRDAIQQTLKAFVVVDTILSRAMKYKPVLEGIYLKLLPHASDILSLNP